MTQKVKNAAQQRMSSSDRWLTILTIQTANLCETGTEFEKKYPIQSPIKNNAGCQLVDPVVI